MKRFPTTIIKRVAILLAGIIVSVIYLAPVFWIFSTSLRLPKDSFRWPPAFLPTSFHIENYVNLFKSVPYENFLINSLYIALIVTAGQTTINCMAAFAFSRLKFRGRDVLFIIMLAGLMVPTQASIIPLFMVVKTLRLTNNHISLILPMLMSPLSVFMLKQQMVTIPESYEEAAEIDGAGIVYRFLRVILPMSKATISMVAVFAFMNSWNDYFKPLIFISDFKKMTIPVGVQMLKGFMGNGSVSVIFAGVVVSLLVPLLVFLIAQKNIMKGIQAGGLKG
ncbi:MAG: carbohydrate ABC transporter permease [Clostridiales bacterium]|nr:carbohydrate ABC transporter permease [Clostridiales bacterium]